MKGESRGVAWEERGAPDAPPILLVRPLGGSMAMWGELADVLAGRLRVVIFDARGSGLSRGPPRVTTRALAADARAVLDARGIARAHVFGISLGGMVATRLALDAKDRVRSLVLASTAATGLAFERAGFSRALGFARCLWRSPAQAERCIVRRVLSPEFRAEHPEETTRIAELAARTPSPHVTIVAHALAALRHDAWAELRAIEVPTLVLVGDRDHLLGPRSGLALAAGISGATFHVIEGAGHDLTLERPHETAQRALELVDEEVARAPA